MTTTTAAAVAMVGNPTLSLALDGLRSFLMQHDAARGFCGVGAAVLHAHCSSGQIAALLWTCARSALDVDSLWRVLAGRLRIRR